MKLLRLKDALDEYHQQRADKHGWLYISVKNYRYLHEARSLATGVICTLLSDYVEETADAEK